MKNKEKRVYCVWFSLLILLFVSILSITVIGCDKETDNSGNGKLSFTVNTNEVFDNDTDFVVKVEGKTNNGENINKSYDVKINKKYDVDLNKGKYTFSIDPSSLNTDVNIFKKDSQYVDFDGKTDKEVSLKISLDTDAMKKKQDEQKAKEQADAQQQKQQQPIKTYPPQTTALKYITK